MTEARRKKSRKDFEVSGFRMRTKRSREWVGHPAGGLLLIAAVRLLVDREKGMGEWDED